MQVLGFLLVCSHSGRPRRPRCGQLGGNVCCAVQKCERNAWPWGEGMMLKAFSGVLEITPGLPSGCWALVPSSQYGEGRNRNCIIKMVTALQRFPYREGWKSLGLLRLMKS